MVLFDIEHKVRTDGAYRSKMVRLIHELQALETKAQENIKYQPEAAAKLAELMVFSQHNMFFMVGYFFPRYVDNRPMSFCDFPFASTMLNFFVGSSLTIRGSRQIGKSVTLSVRQILNAALIPGYKSMYICPHPKQLDAYAAKLKETERAYRFFSSGGKGERRNLLLKEYGTGANQSTIDLMYVLGDPTVVRGRTCDSLLIDECISGSSRLWTGKKFGALVDFKPGDPIVGFDEHNQLGHDTVKRIVRKGLRPTWRINLHDGRYLECTSNERLRTSYGWLYLSQMLSQEEAQRCPKAIQVQSAGELHLFDGSYSGISLYTLSAVPALSVETPACWTSENMTVWTGIRSIEYIGQQEVWDVETDRLHTFFANGIAVHNCQNFDGELETEVSQVNSASKKPITMYTGTSITTDSFLEAKFQASSQGYAAIKCSCGHVNIPLPDHNVMDMIQLQGPTCTKVYKSGARCGRLLNVRNLEYVHANQSAIAQHRIGYHIPQIIVPAVVENRFRWQQVYDRKFSPNLNKYFQELLGIPSEQGDREMTRAHLEAICTLGPSMALKTRAMRRQYDFVVSGCDWGGTDYDSATKLKVSTTVHVMLGVTADGYFDIIHMKRYLGMDFETIGADIVHNHKALNGTAIGSDTGVGMAYNSVLRRHIAPETHMLFTYVGPRSAVIAEPGGDHAYNQWSINKTETLTMLFQAVKARHMRCYNWEEAQPLLSDFLNMYRAPAELPGGASILTYRPSATKPNDCMQATNYAYIVGKILRGEPIFADEAVRMRVEMALKGGASQLGQMMSGMRVISG